MERRTFLGLGLTTTGTALLGLPLPLALGGCADPLLAEPILGDSETRLIFDEAGNRVELQPLRRRVTLRAPDGLVRARMGGPGVSPEHLNLPVDAAIAPDGLLHVLDRGNSRVLVFDGAGRELGRFGAAGSGDGELFFPAGIAIDADGRVLVADTRNHRLAVFGRGGGWLGTVDLDPGARLADRPLPYGLALGPDGSLHVVDKWNGRVLVLGRDLAPRRVYGDRVGLARPESIAIDAHGRSYVGDVTAPRVHVFAADGRSLGALALSRGGRPVAPVQLALAPDGSLHVAAASAS